MQSAYANVVAYVDFKIMKGKCPAPSSAAPFHE